MGKIDKLARGGRGERPENLKSHGTPPRLNHDRNAHPGESVGMTDENGHMTDHVFGNDHDADD